MILQNVVENTQFMMSQFIFWVIKTRIINFKTIGAKTGAAVKAAGSAVASAAAKVAAGNLFQIDSFYWKIPESQSINYMVIAIWKIDLSMSSNSLQTAC